MFYTTYNSPIGNLFLCTDGEYLTGLNFDDAYTVPKEYIACGINDYDILKLTAKWLDMYFDGIEPDFTPRYRLIGLTPFRKQVVNILNTIPYGQYLTYGEIAAKIAKSNNVSKMSAQAVGGAVGWNPICIIIPCHRVLGNGRHLVGYGGGINNKIALLTLEKIEYKE